MRRNLSWLSDRPHLRKAIANFKIVAILLLKFAVWVVLLTLVFALVLGFSYRQAFGLGLVIMIAIDVASSRKGPSGTAFRPYQMKFHVHLYPMLLDLGFVKDPEEYHALAGERPPWSDRHVFHHWIRAYVLTYDASANIELTHYPELGYYASKLDSTSSSHRLSSSPTSSSGSGVLNSFCAEESAATTSGSESRKTGGRRTSQRWP